MVSRAQVINDRTKIIATTENMTSPALQAEESPHLDTQILQGLESSAFTEFSYSSLKKITNNFCDVPVDLGGNKLGEGAFGVVYLAKIFHPGWDKKVAVKRLNSGEIRVQEQFQTEIKVLSK